MANDAVARYLKARLIDTILFCQLDGLALGLVGIVAKALKAVRSVAQLAVKQSQRLPTQDRVIQIGGVMQTLCRSEIVQCCDQRFVPKAWKDQRGI